MLGGIIGDIVGSRYEFNNIKTKDFALFTPVCSYTDDSILTVATANWLVSGGNPGEHYLAYALSNLNPAGGYGSSFLSWISRCRACGSIAPAYNSCGNGSAMRIGPVGWAFETIEDTLSAAKASAECTHNHPEGIKGAQAVALAIFMARNGVSGEVIRKEIEKRFGYDLSPTVTELNEKYSWDGMPGADFNGGTCQGSVPQAIICALEATGFEDAIRNAISIGGDSDTIGCITGSIAEALYGIPQDMAEKAIQMIEENGYQTVVQAFENRFKSETLTWAEFSGEHQDTAAGYSETSITTDKETTLKVNSDMPEISEKIQKIIDRRREHLPVITKQKKHLQNLRVQIDRLDSLVGVINNEIAQKQGPYYNMIAEDGKIEQAFRRVNTADVRKFIAEELAQLENLEKRFSRESICIAMIGYERQGKSTFLQAISGLGNSVIPAYSGTSCTGAVSVIHNTTGSFRAEVEWYSHDEFLAIVRGKLRKFFPDRTYNINNARDLAAIDISGFKTKEVFV